MKNIDEYVNKNYNIAKKLLEDLISIRTVKDTSNIKYPFGKNLYLGQKIIYDFCHQYGIPYFNLDNYISFSHYGNVDNYFSIWTHLDVVPEGDIFKWNSEPFKLTQKDGKLYGRGIIDNKSSIVYSLLFLKYLVDNRIKTINGVRVVYGNDEESGFNDLKYYKKFYDTSELSFVLDNLFPVVDIEKGVINFDIIINNDNNIKINGGTKRNVVASDCEFIKNGEIYKLFDKMGHASLSNDMTNSIVRGISLLEDRNLNEFLKCFRDFKKSEIFIDNFCSINIGRIETNESKILLELEIRYVLNSLKNIDEFLEIIKKQFINYSIDFKNMIKPKTFDKNIIEKLLKEYNDYYGKFDLPQKSGYITYAHSLDNAVPFGPYTSFNNSLHNYNEYIEEEEFKNNIKFYTKVLSKRMEVKNNGNFKPGK